jgi:hypothetical protein
VADTNTEVTQWKSFVHDGKIYDLSHLDAQTITYVHSSGQEFQFFITYGLHCFAKESASMSESEQASLLYHAPRESRPFHFQRYAYSKHLPDIIQNLGTARVFDAGWDGYTTIKIWNEDGTQIDYKVVFKAFREKKKLRLHISSAYEIEPNWKMKPVSFFAIAQNLLANKAPPRNNK